MYLNITPNIYFNEVWFFTIIIVYSSLRVFGYIIKLTKKTMGIWMYYFSFWQYKTSRIIEFFSFDQNLSRKNNHADPISPTIHTHTHTHKSFLHLHAIISTIIQYLNMTSELAHLSCNFKICQFLFKWTIYNIELICRRMSKSCNHWLVVWQTL
jgi:hypothetical protein